ncbi:LysE family translocator [Micromonospora sp. NBC_00898]|uniref:LysE family translocator n=1 Tax=Micromonospora sp. NBC_00898 TaxID=2975981 RepID=UPI00386BA24A|nr:LysE family translocator [Micromonospora sp. NBC_00898]
MVGWGSVLASLLAFAAVAAVLTVTPGVDTLLMVRTAAVSGRRVAFAANAGISFGCLVWGIASAVGLTALLAASQLAYDAVRYAGAAYLLWLGIQALRSRAAIATLDPAEQPRVTVGGAFRQGVVTNLLNPKVGIVYLSLLPQFIPPGYAPLPASVALVGVHLVEGVLWCGVLVLLVDRVRTVLMRPRVKLWFGRATGVVFVGLGVRLAVDRL